MFHPLILAHSGGGQTAKTAAIVLQSLTPNAQSVFKVLAEYQMAHPDEEGKYPLFFSQFIQFISIYFPSLKHENSSFRDGSQQFIHNLSRALPCE